MATAINIQEYLLICLAEECSEVQQRICKALRFGFLEVQPDQPLNNLARIALELADLHGVLELLAENGCSIVPKSRDLIEAKKAKVTRFMELSRKQGTLQSQPEASAKGETTEADDD